eukprot:110903-Heterocapsa_arctica.AAC.1
MHPGRCTVRGASALVDVGPPGEPEWVFAERVLAADRDEWLDDKRAGAGRDSRLNSVTRTENGIRRVLLREALDSRRAGCSRDLPPCRRSSRASSRRGSSRRRS